MTLDPVSMISIPNLNMQAFLDQLEQMYVYFHVICFLSKSIRLKTSWQITDSKLIVGFGVHYLVNWLICISHQLMKYLLTTSKKNSFVNCKWPPGLVRKSNFPASILFTVSNNQFQNLNIFWPIPQIVFVYFYVRIWFLSKSIWLKTSCKFRIRAFFVNWFSCFSHQYLKYLSTTSKKNLCVNCKWPPGLVRKYNFPVFILFTVLIQQPIPNFQN